MGSFWFVAPEWVGASSIFHQPFCPAIAASLDREIPLGRVQPQNFLARPHASMNRPEGREVVVLTAKHVAALDKAIEKLKNGEVALKPLLDLLCEMRETSRTQGVRCDIPVVRETPSASTGRMFASFEDLLMQLKVADPRRRSQERHHPAVLVVEVLHSYGANSVSNLCQLVNRVRRSKETTPVLSNFAQWASSPDRLSESMKDARSDERVLGRIRKCLTRLKRGGFVTASGGVYRLNVARDASSSNDNCTDASVVARCGAGIIH